MMDPTETREHARENGRFARLSPLLWVVWLPFVVPPVAALLQAHPAPFRLVAHLGGVALFVAVYLWAAWHTVLNDTSIGLPSWRLLTWRWAPLALLVAVSFLTIGIDGSRWMPLLIYTSASVGGRLPTRLATWTVGILTLLTLVVASLTQADWSNGLATTLQVGGIGSSVIILCWAVSTNRELRAAREENARLAVTAERLRIARDLHDLLGHDLSLIALKSELAEYLVAGSPDQAIAAMREVGGVARTALREVRAAVAGYRKATLASELRGAREMLAAAGIEYEYEDGGIAVPSSFEAVLAWTVREGVTNVIRHSRARHCAIRLIQQTSSLGIEVVDDGAVATAASQSPDVATRPGGQGLAGLSERVAALDGRYEAGPLPDGGFRLLVVLPVVVAHAGFETTAPAADPRTP